MKGVQDIREDPSLLQKGTVSGLPLNYGEKPRLDGENGYNKDINPNASAATSGKGLDIPAGNVIEQGPAAGGSRARSEFWTYFSEWRHAKILLGTTVTWFLLDITFYGINLNQSIVIAAIGYASSKNPWIYIFDQCKANVIIAAAGFLPGYYATMLTVEHIGRRPILIGGFLFEALFLAILAGDFVPLEKKHAAFIVVFSFLQFFFNFGANTITFLNPAEVFPTRVRGSAHGLSAASGKVGAIIASLGFATAATNIGTNKVLWIFFAISMAAVPFCFLIPETKQRDADVVDLEERQAAAGYGDIYHTKGNGAANGNGTNGTHA